MNAATINPATPSIQSIRILKTGTCPTLSGKGTLQYHVGCSPDGDIHLRVHANSGSGFFSREFISMNAIQRVSNTIPLDKPITSYMLLNPIYVGRSQNSPGFMLAVLKQEGLVIPVDGDERVYYRTDGAEFYAQVKALINSDVDIKIEEKPKKSAQVMPKTSIKKSPKAPRQKNSL